jgi:hypothetical protein
MLVKFQYRIIKLVARQVKRCSPKEATRNPRTRLPKRQLTSLTRRVDKSREEEEPGALELESGDQEPKISDQKLGEEHALTLNVPDP